MKELKVHIQHVMFLESKYNKNVTKTAKKISSMDKVWLLITKFCSDDTSLRDEPILEHSSDLNQDAFRELADCNLHKGTWLQHFPIQNLPFKEDRTSEPAGCLGYSYS